MRKINITIQIEDNDFTEFKLRQHLFTTIGENKIIDYRVFPNVEHLKDDKAYNLLLKAKRSAGLELDRYINNNRDAKNTN